MNAPVAHTKDHLLKTAASLFRLGNKAAALPAYDLLLAKYPDLPNSWFNLAICQRDARRFDDALSSYARAIKLGISQPEEAHLQRGVIFADDLGQSDNAKLELEIAIGLNACYVPALINLGSLFEDVGEWSNARTTYDRVIALDPANALALSRRLLLADADCSSLQAVRQALSETTDLLDRADLGFALGAALDRSGSYDEAFAAYTDANFASRSLAIQSGMIYDDQKQSAFVKRLISNTSVAAPGYEDGEQTPLFICGMFRSGSTLIEQILARHPGVIAGGEIDVLPSLIRDYLNPYPERIASLSLNDLSKLRRVYLDEIKDRANGSLIIDKRPDNFLHIGLIKTLFPKSKIIHTCRNKNDICLSIYFLHASAQLPYASNLTDIISFYEHYRNTMDHWKHIYNTEIFEVDYDALVLDPKTTIEKLLMFCGLKWHDDVMRPDLGLSAIRTASNWQVRQPLYLSSSGRWRNYRQHVEPYGLVDPAGPTVALP